MMTRRVDLTDRLSGENETHGFRIMGNVYAIDRSRGTQTLVRTMLRKLGLQRIKLVARALSFERYESLCSPSPSEIKQEIT